MKRLSLKTPDYSHQFNIRNGSICRAFTWWEFYPSWEALQDLHKLGIRYASGVKLNQVLRAVGSHATLWIDGWEGRVAPMDAEPEGWTFPNGDPLPKEWWWQWYPGDRASQEISAFLNMDIQESWNAKLPFKFGIPFQFQRSMGAIEQVNAIPIQRLPGLVKKGAVWIFEY